MRLSFEEFLDESESYAGYCTVCDEITRYETEPDAENYPCPDCGTDSVKGLEDAMMMGEVVLVDDE